MPTLLVPIRRCGLTLFAGSLAAALLAAALVPDAGHAATADEAEKTCRERYHSVDRPTVGPGFKTLLQHKNRPTVGPGIQALLERPGIKTMLQHKRSTPASKVKRAMPSASLTNRDAYPEADPNPVKVTAETPVSTFGADIDRASYALVRRHLLERHVLPPADAVRTEEIINAFRYSYEAPKDMTGRFKPSIAIFAAPWAPTKQLLRIGIKAAQPASGKRPPTSLVFLIDVSGSMSSQDKLPLAKTAVCMLLHQLNSRDRVAIVVYAGAAGTALEPTPASEREIVLAALDKLKAGGSTAGGEGIRLAYALAEKSFRKDGVNRVILASDGDFNVGISDPRKLRDFVARKRETGVFLTVLGFGLGNYRDTMMQTLAQTGNGMAAYIDGIKEARRVLVDDFLSSLVTVARDVKFQIEFNPRRVAEYRLIGYETRLLDRTDFNNDRVDSGDIGAGHTVTALYELTMVGGDTLADPLRYAEKTSKGAKSAEIAFLRIRFKAQGDDRSKLIERPVTNADVIADATDVPTDALFAAAAAWFGEALRNSPHVPVNWPDIRRFANAVVGDGDVDQRQEFLRLVSAAEEIAASQS